MNELHDEPHLRLLVLNKINALIDKSLDYAWELSHDGIREKHGITVDKDMYVNRYTDIINDKLDLVNEIGELIDSYMADAYNIVDSINKSHNNSSAYDILAEDLKKCKDTILKMINTFNVRTEQDKIIDQLNENEYESKYKSDLLNKMSDNNILSSKNLLQDRKIFNYMGMILKKFIWEQFICGKLYTTKSNKHITILQSRNRSIKNIKITMRKEEIFIRIENNSKKK